MFTDLPPIVLETITVTKECIKTDDDSFEADLSSILRDLDSIISGKGVEDYDIEEAKLIRDRIGASGINLTPLIQQLSKGVTEFAKKDGFKKVLAFVTDIIKKLPIDSKVLKDIEITVKKFADSLFKGKTGEQLKVILDKSWDDIKLKVDADPELKEKIKGQFGELKSLKDFKMPPGGIDAVPTEVLAGGLALLSGGIIAAAKYGGIAVGVAGAASVVGAPAAAVLETIWIPVMTALEFIVPIIVGFGAGPIIDLLKAFIKDIVSKIKNIKLDEISKLFKIKSSTQKKQDEIIRKAGDKVATEQFNMIASEGTNDLLKDLDKPTPKTEEKLTIVEPAPLQSNIGSHIPGFNKHMQVNKVDTFDSICRSITHSKGHLNIHKLLECVTSSDVNNRFLEDHKHYRDVYQKMKDTGASSTTIHQFFIDCVRYSYEKQDLLGYTVVSLLLHDYEIYKLLHEK
jgi:hypothetical protein